MQPTANDLTEGQIRAVDIAERVSSGLSLAGAFFIISTFTFTRRFRRPVNRLIFYASFGNVFSNIATLIGRSAIDRLHGREFSPFCAFQGFLIQTFMPADALFALCMAINVYLNVIHKFEALSLRKLELYYVLGSYLLPFTVGFVFLWIKGDSRGPIYGDAILWCWISQKWDLLRIAAFYGPCWFIVLATFLIYAFTFRIIIHIRKSLRNYRAGEKVRKMKYKQFQAKRLEHSGQPLASSNPLPESTAPVTTENNSILTQPHKPENTTTPAISFLEPAGQSKAIESAYKSANSSQHQPTIRASSTIESMYKAVDETQTSDESNESEYKEDPDEEATAPAPVDSVDINPTQPANAAAMEKARSAMRANRAAWAYARCAMLFFCGLIATWLPSSMNRVYQFVHDDTSFALLLLSALVLPAQGFWNLLIYTSTSWRSCKRLWRDIKYNVKGGRPKIHVNIKVEGCARASMTSDDEDN